MRVARSSLERYGCSLRTRYSWWKAALRSESNNTPRLQTCWATGGRTLSMRGATIRERRMVDAGNLKEYQYEAGIIPTEWEAWIRKKRKDPPTIEEILKNENYREEIKLKAKEAYEKDRLLQAKDGLVAEPVQTQIKGHASAHYYGKNEPSPDPTSTASTFQPGSWTPQDGSSRKK
uniref:NADH:ubiquinone oxidoreductase complex assembly factor 2 n=1 Tax=Sphenodon punctatus TaxID=8508 RepID=A0A8D0GA18_SPHPU